MMGVIKIKDLELDCIIGDEDWEKKSKQTVFIDIDLKTDFSDVARSDSLKDTVDYTQIKEMIYQEFEESDTNMIEKLATDICDLIKEEFEVEEATVTVKKPTAMKEAGRVSAQVTR